MRWNRLFIPTLREAPAGIATAGSRLLTRAGYLRGGAFLFLGRRLLRRIVRIVREEMDALGAQELLVPPRQSMAELAGEIRSYKQLPQIWYQFQDRFGACSFGREPVDLAETLRAILRRCGIDYRVAEAAAGETWVVFSEHGEVETVRAEGYLAELSCAVSDARPTSVPDPEGDSAPEPFHTPNRKTIAELAGFTGLPETSHIKSLVMMSDGELVMALLRGDHQLSESKLARALGAEVRPAEPEEIRKQFGANAGSLGPVGIKGIRILADQALRGRRNMIAGANRDDYHLRNVTPGEDFACEFLDLRLATEGDTLRGMPIHIEKAVVLAALAHSESPSDLHVTDESGKEVALHVRSVHAYLDRIVWAAAEQHHDPDGLALPPEIAPFDLVVTPVEYSNPSQQRAAAEILDAAAGLGLDVLLDDRDERPGVKFKDADLIGVPWRITIGKKLEQGSVEVVERASKYKTDVPAAQAIEFIRIRR
jgi:prolyl-tRNA synthetase